METMQTYLVAKDADDLWSQVTEETEKRLSLADDGFDHEFGYEPRPCVAYDGPPELHYIVLNPADLPDHFHRTFRIGGCDGEHRGRCREVCREVEAEFFFTVSQEPHDLGALVTVAIDPEAGVSIR